MRSFLRKASRNIRLGLVNFIIGTVLIYGPVCVMTWHFDLPDDFSSRVLMNLLAAIVPLTAFLFPPKNYMSKELIGFALVFALMLLFLAGEKYDWKILASNTAMVLVVFPLVWWVWKFSGGSWFLLSGLVFAFIAMMIYWIAALIKEGGPPELLLMPLLIIAIGGLVWVLPAHYIWNQAKIRKNRRIGGPGWQAAAMVFLFIPVITVAFTFPDMLRLKDIWSAVSLTLVGVLLSAVISEPLRRFLLECGNLVPNQNSTLSSTERKLAPTSDEIFSQQLNSQRNEYQ